MIFLKKLRLKKCILLLAVRQEHRPPWHRVALMTYMVYIHSARLVSPLRSVKLSVLLRRRWQPHSFFHICLRYKYPCELLGLFVSMENMNTDSLWSKFFSNVNSLSALEQHHGYRCLRSVDHGVWLKWFDSSLRTDIWIHCQFRRVNLWLSLDVTDTSQTICVSVR